MIRNLKILIFLCTVALCCAIPATLWLAILGRFTMMFATAVAALLLIAMLIVLSRDLRVQKLMGGGYFRARGWTDYNRWHRWY